MSLRRPLVALGSVVAGLLVAELGFRAYVAWVAPAESLVLSSDLANTALQGEPDALGEGGELPLTIPHPYVAWTGTPGLVEKGTSGLHDWLLAEPNLEWLDDPRNNIGTISRQDIPYARQPNDYVVLIVGGSVASWFAVLGSETLHEVLTADERFAGRNVVVLNGAVRGHKQPQQLMAVAFFLVLGLEVDLVINIDGFNEVALGTDNAIRGVDVAYPGVRQWSRTKYGQGFSPNAIQAIARTVAARAAQERASKRAVRWGRYSLLLDHLFSRASQRHAGEAERFQLEVQEANAAFEDEEWTLTVRGPTGGRPGVDPVADVVTMWERSSRALNDLLTGRGVDYLHVLQPAPHDWREEPPKPFPLEELRAIGPRDNPIAEAVAELYPLLRERGEALRAEGLAFEDMTAVFADYAEQAFYDRCHMLPPANRLFVRRVAEAALALPLRAD